MKKLIITTAMLAGVIFVSCKKERTCSCTATGTTTTTEVPSNGGTTDTEVSTSIDKSEETYSKIKKNDMREFAMCNSRTETSTSTYSYTSGSVTGTFVVNGNRSTVTEYNCEIK